MFREWRKNWLMVIRRHWERFWDHFCLSLSDCPFIPLFGVMCFWIPVREEGKNTLQNIVFIFTVNLIWIVTQIQSDTFTKLLDIHFTFRSTFGYIHNWLTNVHYFPALDIYEVSFDLIFVPLYLSGWHPGVVSRFGEVGTISKHSNMNHNHGIHPFYSRLLELRDGVKGCHSIYFDLIHHH